MKTRFYTLPESQQVDPFPYMVPCDPDTGVPMLDCFSIPQGDAGGDASD
jgi:hypothetical protein